MNNISTNQLYNDNILTEEVLENILYSLNKHAKIIRDQARNHEWSSRRIKEDNPELFIIAYGLEYKFFEEDECQYYYNQYPDAENDEKVKEVEDHDKKSEELREDLEKIYDLKNIILNSYLTPISLHASSHYSYRWGHVDRIDEYVYYMTQNHSFHLPVDYYEGDGEALFVEEIGSLFVEAPDDESELIPLKDCIKACHYMISNKDSIAFIPSEFTKNYPGDMEVFRNIEPIIYKQFCNQLMGELNSSDGSYPETYNYIKSYREDEEREACNILDYSYEIDNKEVDYEEFLSTLRNKNNNHKLSILYRGKKMSQDDITERKHILDKAFSSAEEMHSYYYSEELPDGLIELEAMIDEKEVFERVKREVLKIYPEMKRRGWEWISAIISLAVFSSYDDEHATQIVKHYCTDSSELLRVYPISDKLKQEHELLSLISYNNIALFS